MGNWSDFEDYDAMGLAELVRKGDLTATELLESALARVTARNPELNAVVLPMYDEARRRIQAGLPDGPLRGVPFLLKDLGLCYKGFPTSFGSRLFADFVPDYDSTLVERYRKAGLVMFGKTNTPEFGLTITTEPSLYGPCRNPWDLSRSTGGSSGGAAAAVASGMVPVAHASDGGGSIRIPAACCGLFGLKPTRGRIPAGPPQGEGWNGMSADHVISRSVRDSAIFLDIASGPALGDPYSAPAVQGPFLSEVTHAPGQLRIAMTATSLNGIKADPECIAAVEDAAKLCESLGHKVSEAAPEIDGERYQDAASAIMNANTAAAVDARLKELGRELAEEDLEYITQRAARSGAKGSASDLIQAIQFIHQTGRQVARFFQSYDILLSPVLLKPPVPLGYLDTRTHDVRGYLTRLLSYFGFTGLFNGTGQPSMSVPLYWSKENLPIGTLFSGRFGEEALLFRLAGQLEQARPWWDRRPPMVGSAV